MNPHEILAEIKKLRLEAALTSPTPMRSEEIITALLCLYNEYMRATGVIETEIKRIA